MEDIPEEDEINDSHITVKDENKGKIKGNDLPKKILIDTDR